MQNEFKFVSHEMKKFGVGFEMKIFDVDFLWDVFSWI